MFAERRAAAMIPATDLARAILWHEGMLDLSLVSSNRSGAFYVPRDGMKMLL